jgi:hypothetical protein
VGATSTEDNTVLAVRVNDDEEEFVVQHPLVRSP